VGRTTGYYSTERKYPAIWATPHVTFGGATSGTLAYAWLTSHGLILRQARGRADSAIGAPGTRRMPLSDVHHRSGQERQSGAASIEGSLLVMGIIGRNYSGPLTV